MDRINKEGYSLGMKIKKSQVKRVLYNLQYVLQTNNKEKKIKFLMEQSLMLQRQLPKNICEDKTLYNFLLGFSNALIEKQKNEEEEA